MNEKKPNSKNAAPGSSDAWFEYVKEDFFPKHGTKVMVALVLIAAGVLLISNKFKASAEESIAMAEELGKGLDYMYAGKNDSALIAFEDAIRDGRLKGLPLAKAALLSGNIHLQNRNLGSAGILYGQAVASAGKVELIVSAAQLGLAVVAMERAAEDKDYSEAISLLNTFINKYGKRTGDLARRYAKTEPVDKVPNVPDALWKLTLCYLEIGDKEKTVQTAERLVKIYGDSPKAADASKLLVTLVGK
ncbi:MAG: tetratricopeptide repeat protein [Fibromonadaceae bacterium]|jgi:tetratricopeptide (TPR) repeat protein|nr:tetratricopeptide repeat protein [Fibromonadaceae bacterium]